MKKIKYLILGCLLTLCMCVPVACGRDDGSETESTTDTERQTTTSSERETTKKSHMDETNGGIIDDMMTDAETMLDDMATAAKDMFD